MKTGILLAGLVFIAANGATWAKMPPLTDAQKAQAAEAKTKADDAAKRDAGLLAKAQDKAVANYRKNKGSAKVPAAKAK
jgi:hypothetical protein